MSYVAPTIRQPATGGGAASFVSPVEVDPNTQFAFEHTGVAVITTMQAAEVADSDYVVFFNASGGTLRSNREVVPVATDSTDLIDTVSGLRDALFGVGLIRERSGSTFVEDFTGADNDPLDAPWVTMDDLDPPTIQGNAAQCIALLVPPFTGQGAYIVGPAGDRDVGFDLVDVDADASQLTVTVCGDSNLPHGAGASWLNRSLSLNVFAGEVGVARRTDGGITDDFHATSGLGAVNGDTVHVLVEIRGFTARLFVWLNADPRPIDPQLAFPLTFTGAYFGFGLGGQSGLIDAIRIYQVV